MNMFERAATAWEVQSEEERAARAEWERKRRDEFETLLKEVTGTSAIRVQGSFMKPIGFEMFACESARGAATCSE